MAQTDLVMAYPKRTAEQLAQSQPLQWVPLPLDLPDYATVMVWHPLQDQEPANVWLRSKSAPLAPSWALNRIAVHPVPKIAQLHAPAIFGQGRLRQRIVLDRRGNRAGQQVNQNTVGGSVDAGGLVAEQVGLARQCDGQRGYVLPAQLECLCGRQAADAVAANLAFDAQSVKAGDTIGQQRR